MNNEKYLLGAMLQWEDCLLLGLARLTESDFTTVERQHVFCSIKTLQAQKVKISVSLIGTIFSGGVADEAMDCIDHAPSQQSFTTHLEIQEKRTANRKLKEIIAKTLDDLKKEDFGTNVITQVQAEINTLALTTIKAKDYEHGQSVTDWLTNLTLSKRKVGAIRTPWPRMNMYLNGGLYKGKTYVIGGLKKTGKSRNACHLSSAVLNDDHGVVWFSMEMPAADIHTNILASETEVNTADIHRGKLIDSDLSKLVVHAGSYMNRDLYVFRNSSVSPEFVAAGVRSRRQKQKVDLVVIDYIQRMKSPVKRANRADEIESIMTALSDNARDDDYALVILSQMSNDSEKKDGSTPAYAKFKGSGAILEAADVGIVLTDINRGQTSDEGQNWRDIDALIVQRAGESDVIVPFRAYLQYSKFIETEREKTETAKTEKKRGF